MTQGARARQASAEYPDFSLVPAAAQSSKGESGWLLPMPARHHQLDQRFPNSASSLAGQKLAALLLFINDVHARDSRPRRA